MPRSARKESGCGIYHVMMRGVNRQAIFDDDEDCRQFMDILADLPFQHDDDGRLLPIRTCVIYAWCLMMNHFHLLVMEKDWKIAEVIKSLASSYVYYYNKKNERIGHLFQERFKSEPCNDMEYFTTLLRYIHQNPVKAKASPRLRMNLDLRDSAEDGSQRMLNALEPGTVLPIHRHKHSSETMVILRGRLVEEYYDELERVCTDAIEMYPGGPVVALNIPAGQWHSLRVIESGTVILEMKNGPYEPIGPEDILSL